MAVVALDLSLGEYELEEPWGRLVEVGRKRERVEIDVDAGHAPLEGVRTFVLRDRTTRASALSCRSVEDAVALARFVDAHLAELRRFLLDRSEPARLRALDADAEGAVCRVEWSFTTGDSDPDASTAASVRALHLGFLAELAPVEIEKVTLVPGLAGGIAAIAAGTIDGGSERSLRLDLRQPAGPGYRLVQVAAAAALARASGAAST